MSAYWERMSDAEIDHKRQTPVLWRKLLHKSLKEEVQSGNLDDQHIEEIDDAQASSGRELIDQLIQKLNLVDIDSGLEQADDLADLRKYAEWTDQGLAETLNTALTNASAKWDNKDTAQVLRDVLDLYTKWSDPEDRKQINAFFVAVCGYQLTSLAEITQRPVKKPADTPEP